MRQEGDFSIDMRNVKITEWKMMEEGEKPPPTEVIRVISKRWQLLEECYKNPGRWFEIFGPKADQELGTLRQMGAAAVQRKNRYYVCWVIQHSPREFDAFKSRDKSSTRAYVREWVREELEDAVVKYVEE